MHSAGKSFAAIGRVFGRSRSSVAGALRRAGHRLPETDPRKAGVMAAIASKLSVREPVRHGAAALASLPRDGCLFPQGDPQEAGFSFCGAKRMLGKPYCAHHHAMAYRVFVRRDVA